MDKIDTSKVKTYPIADRESKVKIENFASVPSSDSIAIMATPNRRSRSTIILHCRCDRTLIGEGYKSATNKGKQCNDKDPDRQNLTEPTNTAFRLPRRKQNKISYYYDYGGRYQAHEEAHWHRLS